MNMNLDKHEFLLDASEAWERLSIQMTGEILESNEMVGTFNGQNNYMYFGCGEGCCDEWWENRESFIKWARNMKFRVFIRT